MRPRSLLPLSGLWRHVILYSRGKHCEKRRNCLLQAIFPFLTMFSTLNGIYFSSGSGLALFSIRQNFGTDQIKSICRWLLYNVPKMLIPVFNRVENIVGKEENAGYFFPTVFSKGFLLSVLESGIFGKRFNPLPNDKILIWFKLKQIADHILRCLSFSQSVCCFFLSVPDLSNYWTDFVQT